MLCRGNEYTSRHRCSFVLTSGFDVFVSVSINKLTVHHSPVMPSMIPVRTVCMYDRTHTHDSSYTLGISDGMTRGQKSS